MSNGYGVSFITEFAEESINFIVILPMGMLWHSHSKRDRLGMILYH